jgi:hypothetical protein
MMELEAARQMMAEQEAARAAAQQGEEGAQQQQQHAYNKVSFYAQHNSASVVNAALLVARKLRCVLSSTNGSARACTEAARTFVLWRWR